jgi:hypothetical protein
VQRWHRSADVVSSFLQHGYKGYSVHITYEQRDQVISAVDINHEVIVVFVGLDGIGVLYSEVCHLSRLSFDEVYDRCQDDPEDRSVEEYSGLLETEIIYLVSKTMDKTSPLFRVVFDHLCFLSGERSAHILRS